MAAASGNAELVKFLLSKGAQINAKDDIGGTPLGYACKNGHKTVIDLLKKYGGIKSSPN